MSRKKKTKVMDSEPIYDDYTLMLIEEHQTEELIKGLVEYCVNLEKQVIDLRNQVNNLMPPGKPEPYFDLRSDLYEVFHDYTAYPKFRHILKQLD